MSETYCIISTSEDGDVYIAVVTREELLARLDESYYGDTPIKTLKVGDHIDCQEKSGIYIIKGETVTPKAKTIVTAWDI